jgi:hypothetical protein
VVFVFHKGKPPMSDPGSQQPPQDVIKAIPEESHPPSGSPVTPNNPAIVGAVVPPPPRKEETYYGRPDPTPWWKTLFQCIEALSAIALVIITTYYTVAAYRQAQSSEKAANAAGLSAYAACISAQVSRNSLLQFEQTQGDAHAATVAAMDQDFVASQSERALMVVSFGEPIFSGSIHVPFRIDNLGKSEARDFSLKFVSVFLPRSDDPDFSYKNAGRISIMHSLPGPTSIGNTSSAVSNPDGTPYPVGSKDEADYLAGKMDVITYADFTYTDIFGGHRWARSCRAAQKFPGGYIKNNGHKKCQAYNQTDIAKRTPTSPPSVPAQSVPEVICPAPLK